MFVRHSAECPRRGDTEYKKCNWPKHLRQMYNGKQHRQSAKTRAWKIAKKRMRKLEAQLEAADPAMPLETLRLEARSSKTIERTIKLFLSDNRRSFSSSNQLHLGMAGEWQEQTTATLHLRNALLFRFSLRIQGIRKLLAVTPIRPRKLLRPV